MVASDLLSQCMLMMSLTERASYKTHMIHKQHSAAMLMSNCGFACISRICIIKFRVILVHVVCTVPRQCWMSMST